jgi:hypothetical protein
LELGLVYGRKFRSTQQENQSIRIRCLLYFLLVCLFLFCLFVFVFCFFVVVFFCVKKKIHQTSNYNYIAGKREWSGGFFSSLQWTINDNFEPKLFLSRSCCKFHLIFKQHDIPYTRHPFQYRTEGELCAWFVSLFTICTTL